MQHVVLFFTLWPILSVVVAAIFVKSDTSIDKFFLRSLELSALVLWICYFLHITGAVEGIRESITGAVIWTFVAIIGEIAMRMSSDKSADRQ